jgi:branched-chain amino acid transport system ATP-binding protein
VSQIFQAIKTLKQQKMSVLLVEQNAKLALKLSDYAYVIQNGAITMSGTGHELLNNPLVIQSYLA